MKKSENPPKPLRPINKVVAALIKKHGGNKSEIAKKLSRNAEKPISPQLLGQYAKTGKEPGSYFIIRWQEVFGEKIPDLVKQYTEGRLESKVSNETGAKNQDDPSWNEERSILIKSLKQFGETNDYLLKRIRELGG